MFSGFKSLFEEHKIILERQPMNPAPYMNDQIHRQSWTQRVRSAYQPVHNIERVQVTNSTG